MYNTHNFIKWLDGPIDQVIHHDILKYIGFLQNRRLKPKSINCCLTGLRRFYDYLYYEQGIKLTNPVKPDYMQHLPKPLPRFLNRDDIAILFGEMKNSRDKAMFTLMLRCGLRLSEVANLTLKAIDLKRKRIIVLNGKGRKDRIVYLSKDTREALNKYLMQRPTTRYKKVFLVQKRIYKNEPISIRGIGKRIEYYAKKTGLDVSCHRLRHTMATQLLNADAMLSTVQELLGHNCIVSTQRYCKVSNTKVRKDYFKAMNVVLGKVGR
jgi:site-specific recombinase XerD